MKNKIKSVSRRLQRGHLKMQVSKTKKNPDGTPRIETFQRTKRGFYMLTN